MIREITPENYKNVDKDFYSDKYIKIFLAGTIDDGESENWQDKLIYSLDWYWWSPDSEEDSGFDYALGASDDEDIVIFNPRRENWDPNSSDEEIIEQIHWEEDHLDKADLIVMFLADDSKSPVSLLELGLYGPSGKMLVCCTNKFYRYNNVKCTCQKYGIDLLESNNFSDICDEIALIYNQIYPVKPLK